MLSASISELVQIQFAVFDLDGLTPLTGLTDSDFSTLLRVDDSASAEAVTVNEIGGGTYYVEFVPNSAGLWYVQAQDPSDNINGFHVEVGPPPDDVVDAIVSSVWAEALPGGYAAGSAGQLVAQVADDVRKAIIMANLTVAAGSTNQVVLTDAAKADDYYNGLLAVVCTVGGDQLPAVVTDYESADGTFTFQDPLPFIPAAGDQLVVLGQLGLSRLEPDTLQKLCDVWQILGLDPENALCVAKTKQEVGDIELVTAEVGSKIVVKRQ
jgi:hypothetical protein